MTSFPSLIVDDELLARKRLAALLTPHLDFSVVGQAACGSEALAALKDLRPTVVFLDIRMPGLDGVAVAKGISALEQAPWIVFVTAFAQHAVQAFELQAVDYLLKPVDQARLEQTLNRIRRLTSKGAGVQDAGVRFPAYENRMIIRDPQGSLSFIKMNDIDWIQAAGKRVVLHSRNNQHRLPDSIGKLESKLDPDVFVRIHRSIIVRLDFVRSLEPLFHGDYRVILTDGTELPMSRSYSSRLRTRFGKLL